MNFQPFLPSVVLVKIFVSLYLNIQRLKLHVNSNKPVLSTRYISVQKQIIHGIILPNLFGNHLEASFKWHEAIKYLEEN